MELSGCNIKKFLIFSQKKDFLIFRVMETAKKFFIFQKTEHSHISGNKFPSSKNEKKNYSEKLSYISGNRTF